MPPSRHGRRRAPRQFALDFRPPPSPPRPRPAQLVLDFDAQPSPPRASRPVRAVPAPPPALPTYADVEAFEPLFRRLAFGDTEDEREDSFAEIRIHVLLKLGSYRPVRGHGFAAWVTTVARNRQRDLLRRKGRRADYGDELDCDSIEDDGSLAEFALVEELASVPGSMAGKTMPWDLVDVPPPSWINTGLSPCSPRTLARYLGWPTSRFRKTCSEPSSEFRRHLVTANVGPFRVTGEKRAVKSLALVMADVKEADPDLYGMLSTAGMLCVRHVRGVPGVPSNHSWGTAIDLKIGGVLDPRGDGKTQAGLLALYKHFHRHGWFWGAEFRIEDAMHFEIANETAHAMFGVRS